MKTRIVRIGNSQGIRIPKLLIQQAGLSGEVEISVRDACACLGSAVAYTTVMTTMDRLFKKGLLARRKSGRAFLYRAAATREEIEGAVAAEIVQGLLQRDGSGPLPILSSLVDAVSDRDRALLDELERLIREKRQAERQRSR